MRVYLITVKYFQIDFRTNNLFLVFLLRITIADSIDSLSITHIYDSIYALHFPIYTIGYNLMHTLVFFLLKSLQFNIAIT